MGQRSVAADEKGMKRLKPIPVKDRLLSGMTPEPNSGCWLWLRSLSKRGYGRIRVGSIKDNSVRDTVAHRVSYEIFKGPIPDGLLVLHKCDVPICINPDHLFLGTQADNNADKLAKGRHHLAKRTHCFNGHPYVGKNLHLRIDGGRRCRVCQCERTRKYRKAKHEEENPGKWQTRSSGPKECGGTET